LESRAKVIAVASGKGGVGKTTIVLNLGYAMAKIGKETLILDADIALPNLDIYTGLESPPISLLEVLGGNASTRHAIYELHFGLKILPCGGSLQALQEADLSKLKDVIEDVRGEYDYILLDVAAGLSKFSLIPLTLADEIILVVNPEPASILDAQKVNTVSRMADTKVAGLVINKDAKGFQDIGVKLGIPTLGRIPDSKVVVMAREMKLPVIAVKPNSDVAQAFMRLAARITGAPVKTGKPSLIRRILGIKNV